MRNSKRRAALRGLIKCLLHNLPLVVFIMPVYIDLHLWVLLAPFSNVVIIAPSATDVYRVIDIGGLDWK